MASASVDLAQEQTSYQAAIQGEAALPRTSLFNFLQKRRVSALNDNAGQSLSLCLIVKNEERNLPRCLDSVRDLAGRVHCRRYRFDGCDAAHRGPLRGAK